MRTFYIVKFVCVALLIYRSLGIPIGRAVGCGREDPDLSPQTRKYCCESFSLDCEENKPFSERAETMAVAAAKEERNSIHGRIVHRRLLGSSCQEPLNSCGTGLECRGGVCRRARTQAHIEDLLERGKLVERQERMDIEQDSSPQSYEGTKGEEDLTMHGQSVAMEDVAGLVSTMKKILPGKQGHGSKAHGKSGDDEGKEEPMFEEDEVAANVVDLLAAKLHVSLNASSEKSIRDVIAGTFDERAEREDEVAQGEGLDGEVIDGPIDTGRNHTCSAPIVRI